jgi:hypothetical protein
MDLLDLSRDSDNELQKLIPYIPTGSPVGETITQLRQSYQLAGFDVADRSP